MEEVNIPLSHGEKVSKSLLGRKGEDARAWKGNSAGYVAFHSWIRKEYGTPNKCEDIFGDCRGSKRIEYALITGREYSHNREDYITLCVSCHRRYDMTLEKRERIMKNLKMYGRDKFKTKNI